MKLKNALAGYLKIKLPDLHLFRDDLAWNAAGNPYPYLLIDEVSRSRKALGSGRFDGYQDDHTPVKLIKERRVLRFSVRAAGSRTQSGGRIAGDIAEVVMAELDDLVRYGSVELPIPGASETVHLERVVLESVNDLPPQEKGEPFMHQVALSYAFTIHRVVEGDPAVALQTIEIEKD
jgi:hypothetical protein